MDEGANKELRKLLAQFRKRSGALLVALFKGSELVASSSSLEIGDFSEVFENFYSSAESLFRRIGVSLKSALLESENISAYVARLTQNLVIFIVFSPDATSFGSVKLGVMQVKARIEADGLVVLEGGVGSEEEDKVEGRVNLTQDEELDKLIEVLKAELKANLIKE